MTSPVNPGHVEWSGDNPGIYLKNSNGEWTALSVYFRVVTSPLGRGVGAIVLGAPAQAAGHPSAANVCITDNEPLMRWLVENYVGKFASFRGMAGLQAMRYVAMTGSDTQGDGRSFQQETLRGSGVTITLRWDDLAAPFAVDVPPPMSATGKHQMYSVFVEAKRGTILLDGAPMPGEVIVRDFLGRRMSTAFLAFSETWLSHSPA